MRERKKDSFLFLFQQFSHLNPIKNYGKMHREKLLKFDIWNVEEPKWKMKQRNSVEGISTLCAYEDDRERNHFLNKFLFPSN